MKYALTAKHSLLYVDLSFQGNSKVYFKRALKIDYALSECLFREDNVYWNFDNDTDFNDALLKNKNLNQAIDHFNSSLAHVTKYLENVSKKIAKSDKMQSTNKRFLFSLFKKYYDVYLLNMPFLFMYWNTENILITQLKKDFAVIFGKTSEDTLRQLLIPSHDTYFAKEKRSMQKIIDYAHKKGSIEKDSKLNNLIAQHLKKFAFTATSFYLGTPMTKGDVIERIKIGLDNHSQEKITEYQKQKENANLYRKKLMTRLLSFPEIKKRLHLACELMYWKNQRLDIMFQADFLIKPLLETIAKLMGYTFHQLTYLRYNEIIRWFDTGKLPNKEEVNKRIKSYALFLKNGSTTLLTNKKDYPKVSTEENTQKIKSLKIIKGIIACHGKAVGKVRIVLVTKDIGRVQKGEILVTPMTRPDMIVGMERAAAFITDQGGMLSHAAIVAREMRKPCIVGTKFATKFLKDGDLVEVNADKGTIKVLN